jgi:hypothetical protein
MPTAGDDVCAALTLVMANNRETLTSIGADELANVSGGKTSKPAPRIKPRPARAPEKPRN